MAELRREGSDLTLHLSSGEKLAGVHGDLRVPISEVQSVQILEDAHEPVDHGMKVGERLPGVVEVGTIHFDGKKIFAAVHHDTPRGIRVVLQGGNFDEWIVGSSDPEGVVAALSLGR